MKYNETIKVGRKAKQMTQQELADAVGITVQQIRRIEKGSSFPNYNTLLAICKILKISITIPEE